MTGIVLKVYNLFWRMGKNTSDGTVSLTNQRIAKLIGVDVNYTGKNRRFNHISCAKMVLQREGLLEFFGVSKGTKSGTWRGGRYRAISHSEWAKAKEHELGHAPCHPEPFQVKVSAVHPGGRAFQSKRRKAEARTDCGPEAYTVNTPEAYTDDSHRVGAEACTDLHAGSIRTVYGGKHAQSVDFEPTGFLRNRRDDSVDAGEYTPAPPKSTLASLDACKGGEDPSLKNPPPKKKQEPSARTEEDLARIVYSCSVHNEIRRLLPYSVLEQLDAEGRRTLFPPDPDTLRRSLSSVDEFIRFREQEKKGVARWIIEVKAKLEKKAAITHWLPRPVFKVSKTSVPGEEPTIDTEMARQLLAQFPEAWDSVAA